MDIGPSEAETFWTEFLRKLRRRGLRGVQLVISDAHEGIKATVAKLMNASWQRCRVHTMRNALAHAGKSGRRVVSAFMATAFAQDSAEAAKGRRILILLADRLAAKVDFDMRSLFRQLFRGANLPRARESDRAQHGIPDRVRPKGRWYNASAVPSLPRTDAAPSRRPREEIARDGAK